LTEDGLKTSDDRDRTNGLLRKSLRAIRRRNIRHGYCRLRTARHGSKVRVLHHRNCRGHNCPNLGRLPDRKAGEPHLRRYSGPYCRDHSRPGCRQSWAVRRDTVRDLHCCRRRLDRSCPGCRQSWVARRDTVKDLHCCRRRLDRNCPDCCQSWVARRDTVKDHCCRRRLDRSCPGCRQSGAALHGHTQNFLDPAARAESHGG
jgi:hypothetical protein